MIKGEYLGRMIEGGIIEGKIMEEGILEGRIIEKGLIEGVIIETGTLREIKPFKHGQIPVLQWLGQTERQTMKGVEV